MHFSTWFASDHGCTGWAVTMDVQAGQAILSRYDATHHNAASCLSSGVALGPEWVFSLIAYLEERKEIKTKNFLKN